VLVSLILLLIFVVRTSANDCREEWPMMYRAGC